MMMMMMTMMMMMMMMTTTTIIMRMTTTTMIMMLVMTMMMTMITTTTTTLTMMMMTAINVGPQRWWYWISMFGQLSYLTKLNNNDCDNCAIILNIAQNNDWMIQVLTCRFVNVLFLICCSANGEDIARTRNFTSGKLSFT